MFRKVLLALLFLITTSAYAGDEIGNGGGQAENMLMLSYYQLPIALEASLKGATLDVKSKELLIKIKEEILTEYSFDLIEFETGEARPFVGHEKPRLAVTQPFPGAKIIINLDIIYAQKNKTLTLTQGISILLHEFGHHHGEQDHQFLDYLGGKVATQIEQSTNIYPLSITIGATTAILTTNLANSFDVLSLVLIKDKHVYDLKKEIALSINTDDFKILNLHWNRMGILEAQIFYNGLEKLIQINQEGHLNHNFF
jgi:hypothetical protein